MKSKVLISCAVTAQLICVFVFAYAKSRFSHDAAHTYQEASLQAHVSNRNAFVYILVSSHFVCFPFCLLMFHLPIHLLLFSL